MGTPLRLLFASLFFVVLGTFPVLAESYKKFCSKKISQTETFQAFEPMLQHFRSQDVHTTLTYRYTEKYVDTTTVCMSEVDVGFVMEVKSDSGPTVKAEGTISYTWSGSEYYIAYPRNHPKWYFQVKDSSGKWKPAPEKEKRVVHTWILMLFSIEYNTIQRSKKGAPYGEYDSVGK